MTLREIVVVTAWNRPDFFHACLSRLMAADDGKVWYLLSLDRGHDRAVREVASSWSNSIGRTTILTPNHSYKGNSFNVLSAYKFALRNGADRVYLVEDDVLVAKDFFEFHRCAHELVPKNLSVSACRNQQFPMEADPEQDDEAVYTHLSYQSLGVSFSRQALELVLPHINHMYLSDPVGYCKKVFPNTKIPHGNAEQDGLIHRVGELEGLPTVYPCTPRAYHAGFIGYHRAGRRMTGSIEERSSKILSMDSDALNRMATSYKDHVSVDLDADRACVSRVRENVFA